LESRSQLLYGLYMGEYIEQYITEHVPDEPQTPVDNIFDVMGVRFAGGNYSASPIDRGKFDLHRRKEIGLPYRDTPRGDMVGDLVARELAT